MPTVYRIKHIPSGLYFCPSRLIKAKLHDDSRNQTVERQIKSNLSKTGKTYLRKPTIKQIGSSYYTHLITNVRHLTSNYQSRSTPVIPAEWTIEEIN